KLLDFFVNSSDACAPQCDFVVVQRPDNRNVVIRANRVHPAAGTPFLGACALLTFASVEPKPGPTPALLCKLFGLTPAEAKLASIVGEGLSPDQAAEELGISRETVRNQLRAVFTKTATHRQSELVALLSRL